MKYSTQCVSKINDPRSAYSSAYLIGKYKQHHLSCDVSKELGPPLVVNKPLSICVIEGHR